MKPILTATEMRAAEDATIAGGVPAGRLMARAGAAVAETALRIGAGGGVLVLCGPGNNGGDGYVVARLLAAAGVAVRVAADDLPRGEAAQAARAGWTGPIEPIATAAPAPLLIDALFGTGLTRPLDPALAAALWRLAKAAARTIAVDLPSGVATDDGAILSPVPVFDMTIALGALKPAHLLQPAAVRMGALIVADIGVTADSRLHRIGRPHLPAPGPQDHKYSRGMVAMVGGGMAGAAMLSATAAMRAGAGYVLLAEAAPGLAGPEALVRRVVAGDALAELLADARIGAVVIGPGLTAADRARAEVALAAGHPLLIDAGALALAPDRVAGPVLMTPHEGEFTKRFGDLPGSKLDRVRAAAARSGATILLKGADSIVAHPDGRAAIAPAAPAWLASAGTGDVLSGIGGAMLARGLDPFAAACAALWLHGQAATIAGPGLIADDLLAPLSHLIGACA